MGEKESNRINTIPEKAMRSTVKQSKKDYFIYSICLCRSYGNAFFIIGKYFYGGANCAVAIYISPYH